MIDRTIQEARDEGFDDVTGRQADIDQCDTCEYNSLEWHEEPCESCTGADNHWKQPTQTNTFKALEALDCISRQAALDAIGEQPLVWTDDDDFAQGKATQWEYDIDAIKALPSAQPYALDEWCTDCKEYDMERHCCPRYNRVIRDAMKMRKRGRWKAYDGYDGHVKCVQCFKTYDWDTQAQYYNFCPNCGADMRGGEEE